MFHISATLLEAIEPAPAPWQRVHHPKSMLPAAISHHPHPVSFFFEIFVEMIIPFC
jgi:hypothetical protein